VPSDPSKPEWKLEGQTIEVSLHVRELVSVLKERVREQLGGMPTNKQQLTGPGLPVFKDKDTLATYNLTDGEALTLKVKVRGGR
jgi:splicing factor 3A subunit 1